VTSPFSPYQPPSSDELPPSSSDRDSSIARRATLLERFAAVMLDGLVSFAVLGPLEYKAGIFDGFPNHLRQPKLGQDALWAAISFAVWFALNAYLLRKNAQTIGKRILRIRIVNAADGAPARLWKVALLRYLPFSLVVLIPQVGPFVSLLDAVFIFRRDRRCIHDHIADTIVIKAE
jgi:uncharacterized RDD family membrane protein YckC